jgi:RNA polymerase sigma factor (sigma-70 family)
MGEVRSICKLLRVKRIYEEEGDFIRKVIRINIGNTLSEDDVFQCLFLNLLEKPIPIEIGDKKRYLYRMIINNIINEAKRIKAYKNRISRYSKIQLTKNIEYDPSEKVAQAGDFDNILQIIDNELPPQIATALRLRYKKNYTNDAIAQAMSISKETGTRYIRSGLKRLRERFGDR